MRQQEISSEEKREQNTHEETQSILKEMIEEKKPYKIKQIWQGVYQFEKINKNLFYYTISIYFNSKKVLETITVCDDPTVSYNFFEIPEQYKKVSEYKGERIHWVEFRRPRIRR